MLPSDCQDIANVFKWIKKTVRTEFVEVSMWFDLFDKLTAHHERYHFIVLQLYVPYDLS